MESVERETAAGNWCPLSGHILFASIRWKQIDEVELQKSIQRLGGKLETFFSNEITCVLTDELTVPARRDNKMLKRNLSGKILSQKSKHNCIVEKAKSLGIQVMRIETFLTWLRPHANIALRTQDIKCLNLNKTSRLNGCFMKIESTTQSYSPFYKMYSDPPEIDFERLFYTPVEDQHPAFSKSSKSESTLSVNIKLPQLLKICENHHSPQDEKALYSLPSSSEPVKVNKKDKRHFCECCKMYYTCLENHLRGPQHLKYVSNISNFSRLTALTCEMSTISEVREKCVFDENENKFYIKSKQQDSKPVGLSNSIEFDQNFVEIMKFNNCMSSDNLNDILKIEFFGSSSMEENDLEKNRVLLYTQDLQQICEKEVVNEKNLFKDLSFSDFIPTDILPDNDRLFSSDASDNESINQNVLNVINNAFNEESSSDNGQLRKNFKNENCVNQLSISSFEDQNLIGRTTETSNFSQDKSQVFKKFIHESWTIKPISEIKMMFVRCSVLPQVPALQLEEEKKRPVDMWIVKDIKDTKLVLSRSEFSRTFIET